MLRILSDLTIADRFDITPATTGDFKQGKWPLADGSLNYPEAKIPIGIIFNMNETTTTLSKDTNTVVLDSDQDATIGASGKITVIAGYIRGVTDQISTAYGTPSAGDPLAVVSGLLVSKGHVATASNHTVAILEEALTGFEHRGASYTAWRFKTV